MKPITSPVVLTGNETNLFRNSLTYKNPRIVGLILLMLFVGCQASEQVPGWVDTERLQQGDEEPGNWLSLGRNFMQQHYSPLNQINDNTVQDLGFAWEYDARSRRGRTPRGLEATPIVVDGVMYTSGAWGVVYALNAKTGAEIWRYDPDVDGSYARRACCDVVNRGVQVWRGRVYVATLDGFLVSLDAATGEIMWRVDTFSDRTRSYTITGAPQVAGGVVVIGNSGAEFGVRGYITAYDLDTGEQAWRFFIVPGDPQYGYEHPEMEMAAETWDPNSDWASGGGGTVWGQQAYDPELNLLYVGTGNSSPYPIWLRSPSGGDNLFLASILAINPDDGRLVWHYQTTPGEIWDYTATMNIVLADLIIDGQEQNVLMQAPKNGFFYVLDRATGELLSAEKYTVVTWASHIDMETGRPVLTGQGWYKDEPKLVFPSLVGGHSWQPMSYSPQTGLVYIPEIVLPMIYTASEPYTYKAGDWNTAIQYEGMFPPFSEAHRQYTEGQPEAVAKNILKAWDPAAQKAVWQVPLAVPSGNGGILSTGGNLVFQGTSGGLLVAYLADTGEKRKEIEVGTGIVAAPMTYTVDGEQYIAVMAGFGGDPLAFYPEDGIMNTYQNYGRIIAFKLGGGHVPLPPEVIVAEVPEPPARELSAERVVEGKDLYNRQCQRCHGGFGKAHLSGYPDLAMMQPGTHTSFKDIVLGGLFSANGMASFADVLSEEAVEAIHDYLVSTQRELYEEELAVR